MHAVKGLEGIIEIDFRLGLFLELLPQGFILQNKDNKCKPLYYPCQISNLVDKNDTDVNHKLIRVCGAKKSSKEVKNLTVLFGAANLRTFLRISWPH